MAHIFICGDTGQAPLLDSVARELSALGHEVVRGPLDEPGTVRRYSQAECAEFITSADVAVFTTRHECSREMMAAASRLRGICYPVIGVETLDLAAANELGIIVGHGAVRENVVGMAEANLMLMLMLLYRVQINIQLMRDGKWRRPIPIAQQMEGKTIGIIGFGRIASALAERLRPLGVHILTYSPRITQDRLPDHVRKVTLTELLRDSDLVTLLTGLTPETRHLLGSAEFSMMRPHAFIVNTGRGAVCDEEALYVALRDGIIAGAALDTFTIEPLPVSSALRSLENVILTPHAVGHTLDGAEAFGPAMVENIARILRGDLPLYCKNPQIESAWRLRLQQMSV